MTSGGRAVLAGLVLGVLFAACGSSEGSPDAASSPAESPQVEMRLVAYRPDTLSVGRATTVTWTQRDAGFHTVTSGTVEQQAAGVEAKPDGKFDSGTLSRGETFTYAFSRPGTYPYYCAVHPATMRGAVTVD